MSATLQFLLAGAALTFVALGVLLVPLWRGRASTHAADRRKVNLEIFRDQLQELDNDRQNGLLSAADFAQAKSELQRRLLDETAEANSAAEAGRRSQPPVWLAALLPIAAVALYVQLGNPQAVEPQAAQGHAQAQELDAMLGKLVDRLKANPDDAKGWVMLARSYKALGRFDEAIDAYARGTAIVDTDAYLLADYAEAIVQSNSGRFNAKADALVARALKIDANSMLALFLAGNSANDREDYTAAITHWERLLPQLEPGSEDAEAVENAIDKARAAITQRGGKAPKKKEVAAPTGKVAIEGEVVLSGKLAAKAKPEDTLYIFARNAEGSRMPLAVIRARVADLPLAFRLDDSSALPGGQKLSAAPSVVLEARISQGGLAQTLPGDLFGLLKDIKPGSSKHRLVIDQVQP